MKSTRRYTMSEIFIPLHAARGSMLSISCRRMKRPRLLSATSSPTGSSPEQKRAQSIPVAIVGAGPAGLTLSSLLSRFGVPSILLEKISALPTHPQAHFINIRTMEIMRHALGGLDRAVFEKCPPRDEWRDFIVCSSVLGRQLARVNNFSQEEAERRDRMSPTDVAHLSQNILLPLMLDDARQAAVRSCPSSQILFQAEVTSLRRNPHANVENAASPLELLVRRGDPSSAEIGAIGCDYIVAADGAGSLVRGAAGVGLSGRRELGHLVNVHFRCPGLGRLMKERGQQAGMLSFVYNEETISVLVAHNVQKGEWACQVPFFPPHQNAEWFTRERCLSIVQHAIGPGSKSLDIQICSVRPWTMNALVADEYLKFFSSDTAGTEDNSKGGVLLMGDAAHQFPPAGGFGLNTGVQDAHNLAWKLAAVHHNLAPPKLLQTYEQERRPVAMRNAALSVRNLKRSFRVMEALGVNPDLGASKAIMGRLIHSPMALNWSDGAYRVAASIWNPEERSENIIRLGRRQLRALRTEGHPYGDARVRELRRLLAEGGGLPLLFPEHDIGFIYKEAVIPQPKNLDRAEALAVACPPLSSPGSSEFSVRPYDMNAPRSRICVGGIMPHFILRLACDGGNTDAPSRPASLFSTVDLPDQLRESLARDRACSLDLSAVNHDAESRSKAASEAARVSLASVLVVAPPSVDSQPFGCNANSLSELWKHVALNVQQDLAASSAGKRSAIPCPLVIVSILSSPRAPIDEDNSSRRVVSGGTFQSSPEDCAQRYPMNGKDSIRSIRARDLEVVARIKHHRSDLSSTVTSDLIENDNLNELGMCGVLLLAMGAVDVSGGALVEAFASAGAEAVLIRPDGHVGWVAPYGTVSGEHGDPSLSLKSALNTLYSGQSIVP